jgi:hypothetical protein
MIVRTSSSFVHAPESALQRSSPMGTQYIQGSHRKGSTISDPLSQSVHIVATSTYKYCTIFARPWKDVAAVNICCSNLQEGDTNPLCRIRYVSCIWQFPRLWLYKGTRSYESSAQLTHNLIPSKCRSTSSSSGVPAISAITPPSNF